MKNKFDAPTETVFNDIKSCAIKLWKTYDNRFVYVDEKVNRIKDLTNEQENAWMIVAMFNSNNQAKLMKLLSPVSKQFVAQMLADNLLF